MEIIDNRYSKETKQFKILHEGDTFMYSDNLFVKLHPAGSVYNAACLSTMEFAHINDISYVLPVECTLTVTE